jgi:hypothetical protein
MTKITNTDNKSDDDSSKEDHKLDVIKLILDNWGGLAKALTLIGALFGSGYYVGYKVSNIEHSSKINSLMNEKDKEIMDIREKYMDKRIEKIEQAEIKSKSINQQKVEGGDDEK